MEIRSDEQEKRHWLARAVEPRRSWQGSRAWRESRNGGKSFNYKGRGNTLAEDEQSHRSVGLGRNEETAPHLGLAVEETPVRL